MKASDFTPHQQYLDFDSGAITKQLSLLSKSVIFQGIHRMQLLEWLINYDRDHDLRNYPVSADELALRYYDSYRKKQVERAEQLDEDAPNPLRDPKGSIRKDMRELRKKLGEFYNDPLEDHGDIRILLGEFQGHSFVPELSEIVEPPASLSYTQFFWQPYLQQSNASEKQTALLFYGVPVFQREPKKGKHGLPIFTRDVGVNDSTEVKPPQKAVEIFVTLGDLLAIMQLSKYCFTEEIKAEPKRINKKIWNSMLTGDEQKLNAGKNAIAVGCARVNYAIGLYQSRRSTHEFYCRYRLTEENSKVSQFGKGRTALASASPIGETKKNGEILVPVVVTRLKRGVQGGTVTLIASNHGRAVERMTDVLTSDDDFRDHVYAYLPEPWQRELPENFQIVVLIDVAEDETFAGTPQLVATWPES